MLLAGSLCYMEALVDIRETAALLGLSVARVRQLRESGHLTSLKNPLTGHVRFRRSQVMELKRERDTWTAERKPA